MHLFVDQLQEERVLTLLLSNVCQLLESDDGGGAKKGKSRNSQRAYWVFILASRKSSRREETTRGGTAPAACEQIAQFRRRARTGQTSARAVARNVRVDCELCTCKNSRARQVFVSPAERDNDRHVE